MNTPTRFESKMPDDDALDSALAAALPVPPLPAGFDARLRRTLASEAAGDLARLRRRLEEEHARELAALRSGYVRLRRDTLATVLGVAFAAGAAVAWAVPWLREQQGVDLSTLLPLLAVAIGMAVGAGVWVDRFGWPRWALPRRG
ncbi:MAG TPA: hypothetical protein VGQ91_09130 [Ideonella sp.]|jgi:hypothetical protein|nr:hypothetical protein [Ideonella sp.]